MKRATKLFLSTMAALAMTFAGVSVGVQQAAACGGGGDKQQTIAKGQLVEIPVSGMDCGSCAGKIAAALQNVDGINTATVSFADKLAKISYDAAKISVEQIVKEIEKAGFKTGTPGEVREV